MIDYDKLKLAHQLCIKYNKNALVSVLFYSNNFTQYDFRIEEDGITCYLTGDIDDLITKLRELTQPEPKYKIGDVVHFINHRLQINENTVESITSDERGIVLHFGKPTYGAIYEIDVYPTKAALIEAQIEYWLSLREPSQASSISKLCPNCGNSRVHDGVCWAQGCSYKEPEFCINQSLKPAFIAINAWYKQAAKDEDEYCNVSGAKLGKHPVIGQMESLTPEDKSVLSKVPYEECKHESDICAKDNSFIFYNECAGNKYYTNITTNEQHCSCGVEADYPHKCKCKKCGEFYP